MKKRKAVTIYTMVFIILVLALFLAIRQFHIFADVIGSQYDLFAKSPLESVYADTIPSNSEIIQSGGQIETFVAQGETEPVTFSVRPNVDLGLVQIDITDLISGNNKIAKENIDLRNVKIWQQCGPKDPPSADWILSCNNPDKTMVHNIPELLVKDNEQNLQAEEIGFVQADKKYYAPSANENFRVDLKKGQTHTFYLSIKAPKDAVAGDYTGTVTFKPQNASQQQFSLKLEVLPFELPESGKEIILHLSQRLADGADSGFADIGREKYEQYLDLVREAGVTSIVLLFTDSGSSSTDNLNWLAGKIKEKGFHGTLILRGSSLDQSAKIRQNLAILQGKGFDVYVYGKDTPNTTAKMLEGLAISKQIHDAGGKVTTSVKKQCSEDLLDPNCPIYGLSGATPIEKIDLPIYMIGTSFLDCDFYTPATRPVRQLIKEYITGIQNGSTVKNLYKEFYYFQIWPEQMEQVSWTKPSYIRTMTGFFLYKSGLDGIVPYGLDAVFSTHGNKEYDDFDAALKDYRAVYRTDQGWLKTLQFETFREGIDDMRYMTKFDNVLAELRLKDSAKADEIKSAVNNKLKVYAYAGVGGTDPLVVTNAVNQANRKFVADKIVEIMAILEPTVPIPITAKGFSVFGNNKIVGGNVFASAGLYLYKFDGANNKWVVYPGSSLFNTSPFSGYYIYNPSSEDKTLSIPYDSTTISAYKVTSGWNMLWSASAKTRSQLRLEIAGQIKSVDEWVSQGKVYQNVFIIDNEKATNGCKYFKLLSTTDSAANCAGNNQNIGSASQIPANKAFWVYVYK